MSIMLEARRVYIPCKFRSLSVAAGVLDICMRYENRDNKKEVKVKEHQRLLGKILLRCVNKEIKVIALFFFLSSSTGPISYLISL